MSDSQSTLSLFAFTRHPWVSVEDALGLQTRLRQSSNARGTEQARGIKPYRFTDEPAYTVLASGPPSLIREDFEVNSEASRADARLRMITEREIALLQSFPESYSFVGDTKTSLRRQIGNAVPPILAQRIAESLFSSSRSPWVTVEEALRDIPLDAANQYLSTHSDSVVRSSVGDC
jgi:site-specific DNA-cytosine methylase